MMLEESVKVLTMQEEILQFSHFTNEDAWELGSYMVEEAARNDLPVAVSIRLNNGYTVFQYGEKRKYRPHDGDEFPAFIYAS